MEVEQIEESTKNNKNEFLDRQKRFQILKREIKLGFCFLFVIAAFTYDWVRFIQPSVYLRSNDYKIESKNAYHSFDLLQKSNTEMQKRLSDCKRYRAMPLSSSITAIKNLDYCTNITDRNVD